MQKSFSQGPEMEKRKVFSAKNHQKNLLDKQKAVEKSSAQKFLLKSIKYFSENRKKPQNFYLFFNFCFSPNWSFELKECTFHNSTLDS